VFKLAGVNQSTIPRSKAAFKAALRSQPLNIAFAVASNTMEFFLYSSGTFQVSTCVANELNHAMVAVGYGVDSTGLEYAIIRNSWGAGWGMLGYMHVALLDDTTGICGLYLMDYLTMAGF